MAGNFKGVSFGEIPSPFGAFRGIILNYSTGARLLKITDFRGNPLIDCIVTVENSGGDFQASTDFLGIAEIEVDLVGTVNIRLLKDKTNKSITYTYSSESLTRTVILQPRLL